MIKLKKILALILFSILFLVGCSNDKAEPTPTSSHIKGLEVNIIDVGQGDSILIKTSNDKTILIDTGSREEKDKLYKFLNSKNIKNIDMLVGTHPHEDHIGNMASVIKDFNIGEVYMPKVTHTTKTFKNTINALKEKGLTIKTPKLSEKLKFDDTDIEFFAPNSASYKDLNNYSIVMKLTHGKNSFLLTGDAEKESENEMISKGYNLKADALKLAHHGSSTSNTKKFVSAVNPKYSVASCGKNNEYNHPHKETIELLKSMNVPLIRTYEKGTVTFTSDGKEIKLITEK